MRVYNNPSKDMRGDMTARPPSANTYRSAIQGLYWCLAILSALVIPTTSVSANTPAVPFDPMAHQVLGVKLGMTLEQAREALKARNINLANHYTKAEAQTLGTELKSVMTRECAPLTFRLREVSDEQSGARIELNLTYPMPNTPQQVWSLHYQARFKPGSDLTQLGHRMATRYGTPDLDKLSESHGGRTLFYGKGLRLKPPFDLANAHEAARDITGMWIEVHGSTSRRDYSSLSIGLGDYRLWADAEDKLRRYMRTVPLDDEGNCTPPPPALDLPDGPPDL
ncbi:MAG: hypothetical protein Alpg2KO_15520 [Alphaproteobacteria bacterium]